jgi:hypothetical protein
MPPEWNTRSIVAVPELFVCGLFRASELPTWLGSAAFSSTLSNNGWSSSGVTPGLLLQRNGLTWACGTAGKRRQIARATDNKEDNRVAYTSPVSQMAAFFPKPT